MRQQRQGHSSRPCDPSAALCWPATIVCVSTRNQPTLPTHVFVKPLLRFQRGPRASRARSCRSNIWVPSPKSFHWKRASPPSAPHCPVHHHCNAARRQLRCWLHCEAAAEHIGNHLLPQRVCSSELLRWPRISRAPPPNTGLISGKNGTETQCNRLEAPCGCRRQWCSLKCREQCSARRHSIQVNAHHQGKEVPRVCRCHCCCPVAAFLSRAPPSSH